MTDEEEIYYYGTNSLLADTDHDGLDDGTEVELWFDPLEADYDKDGRLDLQEYTEGTDPYGYNKDWNEYVWDFICGFVAGDFIENPENVAVMTGQIISSLFPLVDIRDIAANLVHEDYGFALLSGVGLIPTIGDGLKGAGKAIKFLLKNIDNAEKVVGTFEFLVKNCDDAIEYLGEWDEFVEAAEKLSKADNLKLTKQQTEMINEVLERAGLSEYKIVHSVSSVIDYKKIFFNMHPELEGKVIVHHSIEQQVLKRYPKLFTREEINAYEMLRGIPKEVNSNIHLSQIRIEWNDFYKKVDAGEIALTKESFLDKAAEIDKKYGDKFNPKK